MKKPLSITGLVTSLLLAASGFDAATAELPSLGVQPWFGYYAVFSNKKIQFTFNTLGEIKILPILEKGPPLGDNFRIPINILLEQVQSNGTATPMTIAQDSWNAKQPATDKLEKAVITGKTKDGVSFELELEQTRGIILIGGHVVDSGTIPKNSIRMSAQFKVPFFYRQEKPLEGKEEKAFQKKIANDHLELKTVDGKHRKQPFASEADASSKSFNEPAITDVRFEVPSVYAARKLDFTASPNTSFVFSNEKTQLWKGFTMTWVQDPLKDPEGKARLAIEAK